MEKRILNVIFNCSGGNSAKGSITNRLTIPTLWIKEMGITQENRQVEVTFNDNKIIIEKL